MNRKPAFGPGNEAELTAWRQVTVLNRFLLAVTLLLLCMIQGCSTKERDRFTLTERDVDPKQLYSVGEGYAWGFGDLGSFINGHGLSERRLAILLVQKSTFDKLELIWPDFSGGDPQANIAVIENRIVFIAGLPSGQSVLMAHRGGAPPMVITPAVLRLAARRLGTSVIRPGTDYCFTQVQMPPGRLWIEGTESSPSNQPAAKPFSVELTADDLFKEMEETRRLGMTNRAGRFVYLAEPGAFSRLGATDARELASLPPTSETRSETPSRRKIKPYTPQDERLHGDVLLDPTRHMAYFSTVNKPGRILKVALGTNGLTLPKVVGAAVLEPQENNCFNASIDTPAGYAYFGTEYPGRIVKVALGSGNESPLRVGSVLLDETENVRVGVVDSTTGVGCFSVRNRLFKIRLGRADEPPAIVNRLELPGSPDTLVSAVVDPSTHTAYFGSEGAEVYKIALGEDDSPLRFVAGLQLQKGEGGLRGALIDFQNGFAWFTSNRGSVVKIALGEKDDPPTRLGALKLESRLRYLEHTFGMDQAGYAYYGTVSSGNSEGAVLKVTLGKKGDLPRLVSLLRLNPGEDYISQGVVDPIGRTLCLGIGTPDCSLLKLSLGEGDGAPRIIGAVKLYSR